MIARGRGKAEATERATQVLTRFGLADAMDRPVGTVDQLRKERTAIARAMAGDPAVLFLDAPEMQFSKGSADLIRQLATSLFRQGRTVIVAGADPAWTALATRTIEICSDGSIVDQPLV